MKLLVTLAAMVLSLATMAAFASTSQNPVRSYVAGSMDMRGVDKSMSVYAEFAGEEDITSALRQRIGELGYPVAENEDLAMVVFKLTPVYLGKASERPKVGTFDGVRNGPGISIGRLLVGIAVGRAFNITYTGNDSISRVSGVTHYWESVLRTSGISGEIEHAVFEPTRRPQEAMVTRVELTVNGIMQTADIVSESYAKDVPSILLTGENLRQAVWYLE